MGNRKVGLSRKPPEPTSRDVAARLRWAKYTAECFTSPEEFSDRETHWAAVEECLVELAHAHGLEAPKSAEKRDRLDA